MSMSSDNEELLTLLCRKGAVDVLHILSKGNARFSDLEKKVKHTTLSKRLKELERGGLIARKILATRPPKTEYSITPLGKKALLIVTDLKTLK